MQLPAHLLPFVAKIVDTSTAIEVTLTSVPHVYMNISRIARYIAGPDCRFVTDVPLVTEYHRVPKYGTYIDVPRESFSCTDRKWIGQIDWRLLWNNASWTTVTAVSPFSSSKKPVIFVNVAAAIVTDGHCKN